MNQLGRWILHDPSLFGVNDGGLGAGGANDGSRWEAPPRRAPTGHGPNGVGAPAGAHDGGGPGGFLRPAGARAGAGVVRWVRSPAGRSFPPATFIGPDQGRELTQPLPLFHSTKTAKNLSRELEASSRSRHQLVEALRRVGEGRIEINDSARDGQVRRENRGPRQAV